MTFITSLHHTTIHGVMAALAAITLISCESDTEASFTGSGILKIAIESGSQGTPEAGLMQVTLTSDDDGGRYSHTWASPDLIPSPLMLIPGSYTVAATYGDATSEGFDRQAYGATAHATVTSGSTTTVTLIPEPLKAALVIDFDPSLTGSFTAASATLHTEGGEYLNYPQGESRPIFVRPLKVGMLMQLTDAAGRTRRFHAADLSGLQAGSTTAVTVGYDADTKQLTFSPNATSRGIVLDENFWSATAPVITPSGFTPGEAVTVIEGRTPEQPLTMDVRGTGLTSLTLTIDSESLSASGYPVQADLLKGTVPAGIIMTPTEGGYSVNLDGLVGALRFDTSDHVTRLTLIATDTYGLVSEPLTLTVVTTPVDLAITAAPYVIAGVDVAEIIVSSPTPISLPDITISISSDDARTWTPAQVLSVEDLNNATYAIRFSVPADTEDVNMRLLYCGELKAEATLPRTLPEFTIEVDPFALRGVARIKASDEAMTRLITDMVKIYASGKQLYIFRRDPDKGYVAFTGVDPGRTYSFTATLFDNPTEEQFTPAVEATTEECLQLPNASFEAIAQEIHYDNMPSGGRFSQSIVEIFNQQNYTSFDHSAPRGWANTNAKTFCPDASLFNTWYVQPSVFTTTDAQEGNYAVVLQTTAFDPHGEPIADYHQTTQPYLNHSMVIPSISYRAAGKIFLGTYTFDASTITERYTEGMPFGSRPRALNGFYHLSPTADTGNSGMIAVEIAAADGTPLCRSQIELESALSYTAFSVPLTYEQFGMKAATIKVMISSSVHTGSIAAETASIITHPDPVTSTSHGTTIVIDNLSLSY